MTALPVAELCTTEDLPGRIDSALCQVRFAAEKPRNCVRNAEARRIAPVEMIFVRPKGR